MRLVFFMRRMFWMIEMNLFIFRLLWLMIFIIPSFPGLIKELKLEEGESG